MSLSGTTPSHTSGDLLLIDLGSQIVKRQDQDRMNSMERWGKGNSQAQCSTQPRCLRSGLDLERLHQLRIHQDQVNTDLQVILAMLTYNQLHQEKMILN